MRLSGSWFLEVCEDVLAVCGGLVGAAQRERFRVPASTTHGPLFARSLSAVKGFVTRYQDLLLP